MRLALLLLISATLLGFSAAAVAQISTFFDIAVIDRDEIATIEPTETIAIVRAPGISLDPATAPASPDPTLARATEQLGLDADNELDLIYRMSLLADCGMTFIVEIDAITGESRSINGIDPNPPTSEFRNSFNPNDPFFRCRCRFRTRR